MLCVFSCICVYMYMSVCMYPHSYDVWNVHITYKYTYMCVCYLLTNDEITHFQYLYQIKNVNISQKHKHTIVQLFSNSLKNIYIYIYIFI